MAARHFGLLTALGFVTFALSPLATAAPPSPAAPAATLSAYPAEPADPNHGKDVQTCGYYEKGIGQEYIGGGKYGELEMNQGIGAAVITECKFPSPPKGKWASIQSWAQKVLKSDMRPGDVVMIPSDESWSKYESSDGSFGRSIHARWYSKTHHFDKTACGEVDSKIVCEASGSKTVRGINMIHFRIDEATKAKAANNSALCQAATKHAIAVSRGLPKFRKNLQASDDWTSGLTYKTRYDGTMKEDIAFTKVSALGADALKLFAACGGAAAGPTTTEGEEFSFRQP